MAKRKPTKPTPKKRLTPKSVSEQIERTGGNISAIARTFGVTRSSVYDYINRRTSLQALLKDERETLLDEAECSLREAVKRREPWAVCFTLKTIGKDRGYVEKQEIEHSGEAAIVRVPPKLTPEQWAQLQEQPGENE